jgi:N-acetyl-anhydromuramyl-L-alanine amidase AmpD
LGLVVQGTSEVAGPLCNILIGRNGRVILIAAGRSNHAGLGGPLRGIPKDSANMHTIGVEVENDGIGEAWTRELLRAVDTTFTVLLDFVGQGPVRHFGHKEWAPHRKIDPAGVGMDADRRRVREMLGS